MSSIFNVQAFPSPIQYDKSGFKVSRSEMGMTLLDYFAGKVLEGELAGQDSETGYYDLTSTERIAKLANTCYTVAIEMLKARDVALKIIEEG